MNSFHSAKIRIDTLQMKIKLQFLRKVAKFLETKQSLQTKNSILVHLCYCFFFHLGGFLLPQLSGLAFKSRYGALLSEI